MVTIELNFPKKGSIITGQLKLNSNYRAEIDGVRAIAVLAVIAFHYFPHIYPAGFMGVDVFFVISGFLITTNLIKEKIYLEPIKILDFYLRRINRLVPSLLFMLSSVLIVGYFVLPQSELFQLGHHFFASVTFSSNVQLYLEQGYFNVATDLKPLMHLWSLAVEEQFYLIWPVFFILLKNSRKILLLTSFIIVTSFAYNLYTVENNPSFAYLMPFTRFWEIALGGLIALSNEKIQTIRQRCNLHLASSLNFFALVVFLFSIIFLQSGSENLVWGSLIATLVALTWIIYGDIGFFGHYLLKSRLLVSIGLLSYPLYLWHWVILVMSYYIDYELYFSNLMRFAFLALSLCLSAFSAHVFEPFFRVRNSWKVVGIFILPPLIIIGFVGKVFVDGEGLPQRFNQLPPVVRQLYEIKSANFPQWRTFKCFLELGQRFSDYVPECDEKITSPKKKKILLWGDSHAAQLYPGLKTWATTRGFAVSQYTYSGCPPVINFTSVIRPNCAENNNLILKAIDSIKPDIIILGIFWHRYNKIEEGIVDFDSFSESVALIKLKTKAKIILAGQVPLWQVPLPLLLIHSFRKKGNVVSESSEFSKMHYDWSDDKFRKFSERININFWSLREKLCFRSGKCMTLINNLPENLESFDYGHLTPNASLFLWQDVSL